MSDPNNTGSESQKATIDLTQYVPKGDYEKAQATSKTETEKLKSELEQAKMSLLDPEYISYLEAKKAKIEQGGKFEAPAGELEKMSPKELLQTAITKAVELVEAKTDSRFRRLEQSMSDTLGFLELQVVEKKHPDFGDYRDEVVKLLGDPKSQLTIEQAYLIAKAAKPAKEGTSEKSEATKKPSGEKPTGSRPAESFQAKDFNNKSDAALDAWDQIVGAGKDTL